jgi:GxxExxY protein
MPLAKNAPHQDITYRVIRAAIEVHNDLGPGFKEEVYQRALDLKMPKFSLSFESQKPVEVYNADGAAVALFYLDDFVEEKVIVEVKAQSGTMTPENMRQVIEYFAAVPEADVALWINFGRRRLEFHRLFPPRKIVEHRRKRAQRTIEQ